MQGLSARQLGSTDIRGSVSAAVEVVCQCGQRRSVRALTSANRRLQRSLDHPRNRDTMVNEGPQV